MNFKLLLVDLLLNISVSENIGLWFYVNFKNKKYIQLNLGDKKFPIKLKMVSLTMWSSCLKIDNISKQY